MMSKKIYAAIFALIVAGLTIAASFNYRGRTTAAPLPSSSAPELLGMLPASDAVAFVDTQRTLSKVVPHIFINDSATFARVNQEIDKFRDETGTDARQFDVIVVGVRFKKTSAPGLEFVTGFVSGRFEASEAIANAQAKAKAKRPAQWKEEQYQGTTIYVTEGSGGFCLAAFDSNTLVFGDIEGIRATLDVRAGRGSRVDSSLVELATINESAVAGFAANVPPTIAQQVAGSDELGKAFASVNKVYGSAEATATMGAISIILRSETGEQAQALAEKLGTLKQLASFYFSQNASQPDGAAESGGTLVAVPGDKGRPQIAVRALPFPSKWVKDVSITAEGSDVKMRLEEPLADIAPFVRIR